MAVGIFRKATGESDFLEQPVRKAMRWMKYQSPSDRVLVAQLPTSDWRDEQWVLGYALYVNTVVYTYLRLFEQHERASVLREMMGHFTVKGERQHRHLHEGLVLRYKTYFSAWSYKVTPGAESAGRWLTFGMIERRAVEDPPPVCATYPMLPCLFV
jgi:hypothetical protein